MRREDWPDRLQSYIDESSSRAFKWGDFDCCILACEASDSITDSDIAKLFRGKYKTAKGAVRKLKRFADGDMLDAVNKVAEMQGWEEIIPTMAQRGDIVGMTEGVDESFGLALGICIGQNALYLTQDGLEKVPMTMAVTAWRVS